MILKGHFNMNKELIEELKAQDFNVVAVSKTRTKKEIDEVAKWV